MKIKIPFSGKRIELTTILIGLLALLGMRILFEIFSKRSMGEVDAHPLSIGSPLKDIYFNSSSLRLMANFPKKIQGIDVEDITKDIKFCSVNKIGSSPGKRKCKLDGELYYLKPVKNHRASREEFNRRFAREMFGIKAPMTRFFRANDVIYISSQALDGFKPACSADPHTNPINASEISIAYKRIGLQGVALLTLARIFFYDLIYNCRNWGYDNEGLVLIDIEESPLIYSEYLMRAFFGITDARMQYSLRQISAMGNILREMSQRPLPAYHNQNGLSYPLYIAVINSFLNACIATIDTAKQYSDIAFEQEDTIVTAIFREELLKF